jgi:hypothetical protein
MMAKSSTVKVLQKHERCVEPLPICTRKGYNASLVLLEQIPHCLPRILCSRFDTSSSAHSQFEILVELSDPRRHCPRLRTILGHDPLSHVFLH